MNRASCERFIKMLSQLEYAYATVSRNARTAQKVFWEIPTREATKTARGIWEFANRHPVITAMVLLLVCTVFLPVVLFSAFVLSCLLIGLITALAFLIGCIVVVGIFSLPFVLPALALTLIAATSTYLGMRVVATAVRWAWEQAGDAFLKPSGVYQELQHRVSKFFVNCTGDTFASFLQQKAEGASEEREAGDAGGDGCQRDNDTIFQKLTTSKAGKVSPRIQAGRKRSIIDAQAGASGATNAERDKEGPTYIPPDAAVNSVDSDDCFTEASEWLTEDEFGNIIPDYRDRDMKLYDAMARRGFKEYEPWPYKDM